MLMKNKFLIYFLIFFVNAANLFSEEYRFEVSNMQLTDEGSVINANNGKFYSADNNLEIIAEKFQYNKEDQILNANKGTAEIKSNNLKIKFNKLTSNEKSFILTAKDNVKIYDLENDLLIESDMINFDRKNNILNSDSKSTLKDKFNNIFITEKFEYNKEDQIIKIENTTIKDSENNDFKIEIAFIDLSSNKFIGKDVSINLNNVTFNQSNEPRLKGASVSSDQNITEISKGVFTACKKTDTCPPWQLSADKITHDRNKKIINYKNVWLKIYDVPVVYFPKFFHPDPTVKRQSGFLMPSFKNSPNKNTFFSVPYYKVLSDQKDLTFTPRFYAKDQILLQTEFREFRKDSKINTDFSIYSEKGKNLKSHLFYRFKKNLNFVKFDNSSFNLRFEKTSNDTYLKGNKIVSPLIKNYDVLETSTAVKLQSENIDIEADIIVYENLNNSKNSDKFEYIFPKIKLSKKMQNNTKLNGDFTFRSNNYVHNYNTNVWEKVNTNDLLFNSVPKITQSGFYNNYEFIIKNANSDTDRSENFKNGENFYLSGLFQFNSTLPMIKKNNLYQKIFTPKIALKISPGNNTKDIRTEDSRLDVNNIFNLERLSSGQTIEGGISLAYGTDFIISSTKNSRDIFNIKLANNLRLNENDDLPNNNQIGAKTSNFYGEIAYSPKNFLSTKYNVSTKNDFNEINYENFSTEIKLKNFVSTFDYLNENNNTEKNSYLLNKTTYNFNNFNNISFSTRENKKTNLTEYYNLIYQYKNDCLSASIEYNKEYYVDRDIKPEETIFFKLSIIPFGETSTPNLKQ